MRRPRAMNPFERLGNAPTIFCNTPKGEGVDSMNPVVILGERFTPRHENTVEIYNLHQLGIRYWGESKCHANLLLKYQMSKPQGS